MVSYSPYYFYDFHVMKAFLRMITCDVIMPLQLQFRKNVTCFFLDGETENVMYLANSIVTIILN